MGVAYEHSCAIKTDGTLWCWGENRLGQLGIGMRDEVKVPSQVTALGTNVAQIAMRHDYDCALTKAHKVYCWGRDGYGDSQGNPTPSVVDALGEDVTALAAGDWHICALKQSARRVMLRRRRS